MFPLFNRFRNKVGLCQITDGWLNTVSNMLNGLGIEMIVGQDHAEIVPPNQYGDGWKFKIPSGSGAAPQGTKTLYMPTTLREYDSGGNIVAPGSETGAAGTSLQPTWDWLRAHG